MSERLRTPEDFVAHLAIVTAAIGNRPLDQDLGGGIERRVSCRWFMVRLRRRSMPKGR